jgi:hypothetical protein
MHLNAKDNCVIMEAMLGSQTLYHCDNEHYFLIENDNVIG